MEYYEEGRAIIAELIERGGGTKTKFIETTGQIIRDTLDYVIDGEASLDDLEGCEKTVFGTKFEKRFVRAMGLPRKISKRVNPHNLTMDTRVAGYDLDIKCTLGSTWMIPREAIGNWCFLVQVDYKASDFSLGLFKALPENLTEGENRSPLCPSRQAKPPHRLSRACMPSMSENSSSMSARRHLFASACASIAGPSLIPHN